MTSTLFSHDQIVFEGLVRPQSVLLFHEEGGVNYHKENEAAILERYFADIQNLFLRKFGAFAGSEEVSETDSYKLRSLLEEMIKVKVLMGKSDQKND